MHSDVVLQGLISNGFWLSVFLVTTILFRKELKLLLRSLARFKVGTATFELRDPSATLEYYAILTNVLVQILSERKFAEKFYELLSASSAQELTKFIDKYQNEVRKEDKNYELLKNVALLVGRKGNYSFAIALYRDLLKEDPENRDLLYLMARMLRDSAIQENIKEAEDIYDQKLVVRWPANSGVWFGRGRTKCLLEKFDDCVEDIKKAIQLGYWRETPRMLDNEQLLLLRKKEPGKFEELRAELARANQAHA